VRFREEIAGDLSDLRQLLVQHHSALDGSLDRRPKNLSDHRQYDGSEENRPDADGDTRDRVDFEKVFK
jgi:hypothetical protein